MRLAIDGNLVRLTRAPWGKDRRPIPPRPYIDGQCEGFTNPCDNRRVKWRGAQTAYYWDGKGEDPNRDLLLCDECCQEYDDYWDSMWADYYSGLL